MGGEAATDAERRVREMHRAVYDLDAERAQAEWELAAYDAVRAGVPTLCALVDDPDPEVRAAVVNVLGWFPEESARIVPRLLDLLADERVSGVAANALVAVGLVGDAGLVDRLRGFLTGEDSLVRWAAATALARLGETDPAVVGELAACCASPPAQGVPELHFYDGDLPGYSSNSLARLGVGESDEVLTSVLRGLSRPSGIDAFAITAAALRIAFGARRPAVRPAYDELTEPQRRTVGVLADLDEGTWRWLNFTEILGAWNLPHRRDEFRRYAGLSTG